MESIMRKQRVTLYRQDITRSVRTTRTVRNIHLDSSLSIPVGEIVYKRFIVTVGYVMDEQWDGRHPLMTARERAEMLMVGDR